MALIGFGIGYYIDKKYFQEPDEPDETVSNTVSTAAEEDGPDESASM